MNTKEPQKSVTLESLAASIEGIADSIMFLATKEEVSKLATKEEVSKLATKEEVSKLATKEEVSKLATKEEMENLGKRLEDHIDKEVNDLAEVANKEFGKVTKEFDKVHVRLDELEKHTMEFRTEFSVKMNQFQNQLDNIYTNYPNRNEFGFIDERVKQLEQKVFN